MRRSREQKWICAEGSTEISGVALGADYVAEHECGVGAMRDAFECDQTKDGIERRRIRVLPENLRFVTGRGFDAIFLCRMDEGYKQPADWMKGALRSEKDDGSHFVCAWDEKTFGIVAYGKKDDLDRARLRQLWEAFQAKDIAFWSNVGPFHQGLGLIFAIASRVPEADKLKAKNDDLSRKALRKKVEEIGIEAELTKAGKRWFALSPEWKDAAQTEVQFWLNPMEQREHNFGWYTVEELRQWAKNTGPVMRTKETKR